MIGIVGSPRRGGNTETAPMKALVDWVNCSQVEMVRARRVSDVGGVRKETGAPRAGVSNGESKGKWRIIHDRFSRIPE